MVRRFFAALMLSLVSALALGAADFSGRWEGVAALPDGSQLRVAFVFGASDGKLTGLVETSEHGNFTANDIVVAGDTITFTIATDGGVYANTGTLKPEGLLVESKGPDGPLAPVLYRRPAVELAGKWRGQVQTPDGPATIVYSFEQRDGQLAGNVSSPMGEAPLTNITVEGNRVAFESDFADFKIKRRGVVTGDTMELTVTISGNEFTATFTREPVTMR